MDFALRDFLQVKTCRFEFQGKEALLDQNIAGVSIDSRRLAAGEIYFALKGENHDGHDFVTEAFDKKARAAVVEQQWWQNNKSEVSGKPIFVVENPLTALQEAARTYRMKFNIPVIGLTGTNGKTTTKEMIAAVLSKRGPVCKTEGNLNNHIGLPLTLFALRPEHTVTVAEMGMNHFGEIRRLCDIAQPTHGLITNIGTGHTEFLNDVDGVAKAKTELFEFLAPEGFAFVNIDDAMIMKYLPAFDTKLTYGFSEEADVVATDAMISKEAAPQMTVNGERFKINVLGKHNLNNALAAIAVGVGFGIDIKEIKKALENVKVPGNRMQLIRHRDMLILDDSYNANPDSTRAALETLKSIEAKGKKIFVLGDMLELGNKGHEEHAKIGRELDNYGVDIFMGFGDLTASAVEAARVGSIHALHFAEKQELVEAVTHTVAGNDVVLVKGSRGMKMEEIVEALTNS